MANVPPGTQVMPFTGALIVSATPGSLAAPRVIRHHPLWVMSAHPSHF